MSGIGVLFVRRTVADMAIHHDQGRPVFSFLESLKRARQHRQIVGIGHARHVPSISDKARCHIFAERPVGRTIQRDVIVVVDPAEIRELQMSGERRRFAPDSLHQIAIRTHRVNVKVEDFEIRAIEICRLPFAGDRHSDAVAHSLPQRPGRGFNSGSDMRFGMSRRQASQLPEALDLLHRHCEVFQNLALLVHPPHLGEVQHGIEQHGRVAVGEHEAVAIQPGGIGGIVAQKFLPQTIGHWAPVPSARRDGRSWPAARRQSPEFESC